MGDPAGGARADRRLVRDPESAMVAGVCAALARRIGVDPAIVRVVAVLLAIASAGVAAVVYLVAWAAIPAAGPTRGAGIEGAVEPTAVSPAAREPAIRPANWRVAAGVGFLTLSVLLVLRELGVWWSDAFVWPLVLAASGVALLWRQSRALAPGEPTTAPPPAGSSATESRAAEARRARVNDLYRGGFGVALVVGAVLLFLAANDVLGDTREVVLTALAAIAGLALILAPFLWRLGRNLAAERAERIRSQERAELAAHLHDSVLQTLTLVQKHAGEPREVAQLARRQERELRAWLFGGERKSAGASLAAALEEAAGAVEDAHGVPIEVVAVGDRAMDERGEAVVAAAREAMVNAAKFALDAGEIAVYAELGPAGAEVFVRDRGQGFDPVAIPADRRGVRESIIGRMERFGGRAEIRSRVGEGTEVALTMREGR